MSKKLRLLIVEDRPQDMRLTERSLLKTGYDLYIDKAVHGKAAVDHLDSGENRPDLILLDWMLPLLSGSEVLEHIRNSVDLKDIPVIVLTTSKDPKDLTTAWELGCNAYMAKPVSIIEFQNKIQSLGDFWLGTVLYK